MSSMKVRRPPSTVIEYSTMSLSPSAGIASLQYHWSHCSNFFQSSSRRWWPVHTPTRLVDGIYEHDTHWQEHITQTYCKKISVNKKKSTFATVYILYVKVTRLIKQRHMMMRFHVLLLQFIDILKKNTILFFLIFEHAHLFNTGLPPGMLWLKQRNNNTAWSLFIMCWLCRVYL